MGTLILILILSIICIREPLIVVRAIIKWARLISGGDIRNSEARKAIDLIEYPTEYGKKYVQQLSIIRLTGWVGLFISVVGSCILTYSR
jgi:hypothetical protein